MKTVEKIHLPQEDSTKTAEIEALFQAIQCHRPKVRLCPERDPFPKDLRIKALFFDGEPYKGKECEIFAYIGFPEEATPESPVPAMVLVHGGAGHAYAEWVQAWVDHGYATIAIDGFGQIPKGDYSEDTLDWMLNPQSHPTIDEFDSAEAPVREQWFYHYLADVLLSHNILREDARVQKDKIGITGISWGGLATSVVTQYDNRFSFAVPVYGCGFLQFSSGWFREIMERPAVFSRWEPSLRMDRIQMPTLWINGDRDPFFSPESTTDTVANAPKGEILLIPDLQHDQQTGSAIAEIFRFADAQNGMGEGNIKIQACEVEENRAVLSLHLPSDIKNATVACYYLVDEIAYVNRRQFKETWKQIGGTVEKTRAVVSIPDVARYFYISIEGESAEAVLHASTGLYKREHTSENALK